MYTYFSRFLHHTLSHSGLTGVSRSNKFATWFHLDYRVKPDNDSLCAGRSMVEMLGVLAIIGVLSVGAIAGYSKAMMKYKLNKHAEQMNTVINAIARNVHSFDNLKQGGTYITSYLIKMGEIPTEMIKQNQPDVIYDTFGQGWWIFIGGNGDSIFLSSYSGLGSSSLSTKSADNLEICKNILLTAKENSANLWEVMSQSNHDNSDNAAIRLFGDNYCTADVKCLKNLNINDIYELCTKHYGVNSPTGTELAVIWLR